MIERIFGSGTDLDALQMGVRALVMFFVALALVRIGGMRAFAAHSPFDAIVAITLGAVLSRAVVGASPMLSTISAGAVMAIVHRALAWVGARHVAVARVLNGKPRRLYEHGAYDRGEMTRHGISARDLDQAARVRAQVEGIARCDEAWLETSGDISVVKRDS